jgi:hypothetical protein
MTREMNVFGLLLALYLASKRAPAAVYKSLMDFGVAIVSRKTTLLLLKQCGGIMIRRLTQRVAAGECVERAAAARSDRS